MFRFADDVALRTACRLNVKAIHGCECDPAGWRGHVHLPSKYDADDPNKLLREKEIESAAAEQEPNDGLLGAGAAEIVLTKRLQ